MTKSGKTPAAPSSLRVSGQKGRPQARPTSRGPTTSVRPQARPASISSSSAPSTSARPMARSERPSAQSPAPRPASQMVAPRESAVDVANRLRRARQDRINARRSRS